MANARNTFDAVREELARSHGASIGLVYGKPAALIGELPFVAFHQNSAAFRLHGRAREHALALPGARPWDPLHADKPDGGWVLLGAQHVARWERLALEALKCAREREVSGAKAEVPPPPLPDPDERSSRGASFAERYNEAAAAKSNWKISK
jgi:hypothetical protein